MYIFLDVDGVLNTEIDWARKVYSIDPECIKAFLKLIKMISSPKIILSSTWRNGIARDGSTAVHIKDLLKVLEPSGIGMLDKTGVSPDGNRSKEISHYLKWHPVDDYLILDDDRSIFNPNQENLYLTSSKTGLTEKDIIIIKRMLLKKGIVK